MGASFSILAWPGVAWRGMARLSKANTLHPLGCSSLLRLGEAGQGEARRGWAWLHTLHPMGCSSEARPGMARQGMARQGPARQTHSIPTGC